MKTPLNRGEFSDIEAAGFDVERVKGIEPSYSAWEADILPMNYTRILNSHCNCELFRTPQIGKKENHHRRFSFLVDDNGLEPLTLRTSSGCSTN